MLISKIITIGDEILIGQVTNTNASFISEKLYSIGIPVSRVVTIEDTEEALINELDDSVKNFNVTIITGGLGPTHDDVTKPTLVKYFKDELISDEKVLEHVKSIFKNRNVEMPPVNYQQAMVPKNSKVIFNVNGTAPGIWIEKNNKVIIALPGVPFEMKEMMKSKVIPMLAEKFSDDIKYVLKSKTILTTGIGESNLAELIGDVKPIIGNNKLAFLPSLYGVRLRIDVKGESINDTNNKIEEIENKLRAKIDEYIFGTDEDLPEKIVGDLLLQKNLTLAVAESCTGGLISSKITDISGSSKYFLGEICSYSNNSKFNILGVKEDTLKKYGAVSEETALEMAINVRQKFNADIGISTTGIAGPTGGTNEKPVGLVWVGLSDGSRTFAMKFMFGNNRERTKIRATYMAFGILRNHLKIFY
jgi:nicotinamide-nucleotide amidase